MSATKAVGGVSWTETSVRWLQKDHAGMVRFGTTWADKLTRALLGLSFMEVEHLKRRGLEKREHIKLIEEMVDNWTETHHHQMVDYFKAGGYGTELAAWEKESAELDEVAVAVTGDDGKTTVMDRIALVGQDEELLDEVERAVRPKSQPSPDHELDDAVQDLAMQRDPRFGVW